ncbi:MAG TPA: hypothetical protein PKI00_01850 [Candidatus Pacearchaeota archaeon]|nr:hypothetical protein [Candidatus Pacearchaeota archaeon]HOC53778.1 hypothetical protein [Candidatus Pacearchaeota archaeon]
MIPNILYTLRDIVFAISVGVATYIILIYSKALIENMSGKKFSIDGYYWFTVLLSVVLGIISLFIL